MRRLRTSGTVEGSVVVVEDLRWKREAEAGKGEIK